jgi:hypothetical protein
MGNKKKHLMLNKKNYYLKINLFFIGSSIKINVFEKKYFLIYCFGK